MKEVFEHLSAALQAGENAVLCSILAVSGSTPRGVGAKMAVFADGSFVGTIGGGSMEFEVLQRAVLALRQGRSCIDHFSLCEQDGERTTCGGNMTVYFQLFLGSEPFHCQLTETALELAGQPMDSWLITEIAADEGWDGGTYDPAHGLRFLPDSEEVALRSLMTRRAACDEAEGTRRRLVEPLGRSECLYVFGGGHVSQALVPVLTNVGFRVVVLEDRGAFAREELFPTAEQVVQSEFSGLTEQFSVAEHDGILIMTRGRRDDYQILQQALGTKAEYVGVIGSRRKAERTMEQLRKDGFSEQDLRRVHTPIGLEIGAETPEEIAISVAAELIRERSTRNAAGGR